MSGITVQAVIHAMKTAGQDGWHVTLMVPQSEVQAIMQLSEFVQNTVMAVAFVHSPDAPRDEMPLPEMDLE